MGYVSPFGALAEEQPRDCHTGPYPGQSTTANIAAKQNIVLCLGVGTIFAAFFMIQRFMFPWRDPVFWVPRSYLILLKEGAMVEHHIRGKESSCHDRKNLEPVTSGNTHEVGSKRFASLVICDFALELDCPK